MKYKVTKLQEERGEWYIARYLGQEGQERWDLDKELREGVRSYLRVGKVGGHSILKPLSWFLLFSAWCLDPAKEPGKDLIDSTWEWNDERGWKKSGDKLVQHLWTGWWIWKDIEIWSWRAHAKVDVTLRTRPYKNSEIDILLPASYLCSCLSPFILFLPPTHIQTSSFTSVQPIILSL